MGATVYLLELIYLVLKDFNFLVTAVLDVFKEEDGMCLLIPSSVYLMMKVSWSQGCI